jgi:hypothetical protein
MQLVQTHAKASASDWAMEPVASQTKKNRVDKPDLRALLFPPSILCTDQAGYSSLILSLRTLYSHSRSFVVSIPWCLSPLFPAGPGVLLRLSIVRGPSIYTTSSSCLVVY